MLGRGKRKAMQSRVARWVFILIRNTGVFKNNEWVFQRRGQTEAFRKYKSIIETEPSFVRVKPTGKG